VLDRGVRPVAGGAEQLDVVSRAGEHHRRFRQAERPGGVRAHPPANGGAALDPRQQALRHAGELGRPAALRGGVETGACGVQRIRGGHAAEPPAQVVLGREGDPGTTHERRLLRRQPQQLGQRQGGFEELPRDGVKGRGVEREQVLRAAPVVQREAGQQRNARVIEEHERVHVARRNDGVDTVGRGQPGAGLPRGPPPVLGLLLGARAGVQRRIGLALDLHDLAGARGQRGLDCGQADVDRQDHASAHV